MDPHQNSSVNTQPVLPSSPPLVPIAPQSSSWFYRLFKGRINRRNYLIGALLFLGIPILLLLINIGKQLIFGPSLSAEVFVDGKPLTNLAPRIFDTVLVILTAIITPITLIIGMPFAISLQIRRLHDLGQSGWLLLLQFVPFVGIIFPLCLFFWPGTATDNKYGSRPLQRINVKSDILKLRAKAA